MPALKYHLCNAKYRLKCQYYVLGNTNLIHIHRSPADNLNPFNVSNHCSKLKYYTASLINE